MIGITQVYETQEINALKEKLETLTDEQVLHDITIPTSQFSANDDEYAEYFPYKVDYVIKNMTSTCEARVTYHPATDLMYCMENKGNTLDGKIRLYANKIPESDIVIKTLIWKELK